MGQALNSNRGEYNKTSQYLHNTSGANLDAPVGASAIESATMVMKEAKRTGGRSPVNN